MATHITGLLLSALIVWRVVKEHETVKNEKQLVTPSRLFLLFLTGLIVSGDKPH